MSELPGYSPYGVPPPPPSSSSTSLAPSASTAPPEDPPLPGYIPQPLIRPQRHNLAGPVQTVSLADKQYDYFKVTRTTPLSLTAPTIYSLSLTTDPTPLYRIEVDPRQSADPAIQLFDLDDPFPLAAARMYPHVKTAAAICTREPAGDRAVWRPLTDTHATLVLEIIPGLPTECRGVAWSRLRMTDLTCTLLGALFMGNDHKVVLAKYGMAGPEGFRVGMIFQILRGGGIECELGIVMQVFAKIEAERRRGVRKV